MAVHAVPVEVAVVLDEAAFPAGNVTTPYEIDELEDAAAPVSFALGVRTGTGRSGSSIFTSTSRRGNSTGTGHSRGRALRAGTGRSGGSSRGRSRTGELVPFRLGGDLDGVLRLSSFGPGLEASPVLVTSARNR